MLDRKKVIIALEEKLAQFNGYSADFAQQLQLVDARLATFGGWSLARMEAQLAEIDTVWTGARPTSELDAADHLRLAFVPQWAGQAGTAWQHHGDARAWAYEILLNQPVIAVDGSQITPTKDLSVPVGAIQIGWFINPHCPNGNSSNGSGSSTAQDNGSRGYIKDISFEVFAPADLAPEEENEAPREENLSDWRVNQARFVAECEKLCELMAQSAHDAPDQKPVCLFDGSFIVSFAGQMRPSRAAPYLRAVQELIACSQEFEVPLVGFVDTSYSRDFVTLLDILAGDGKYLGMGDAALFNRLLPRWGDRTPAFICARNDALTREDRAGFYTDIIFTYVRTTTNRPPARLELPRWVLEAGLLERVVNVVRAECVVGGGYPYAIETVDALAVISQQDRQRFYALFEQFATRLNLGLTQARKAASKQARR